MMFELENRRSKEGKRSNIVELTIWSVDSRSDKPSLSITIPMWESSDLNDLQEAIDRYMKEKEKEEII